jgi:phosphate transport system permease protein
MSNRVERAGDRFFRYSVMVFGGIVIGLAVALAWQLVAGSHLAWSKFGWSFLWSNVWDPVEEIFGARPFLYGTLVSSCLALALAVPLGVGSAIFLAEMAPRRISNVCGFLIEILAAVPSVVLGLMGIFILVPAVRGVEPFLDRYLGFLPFFRGAPYGVGMLSASLILAFMILPYITSISREVLLAVPRPLKEGVLALGATRWEMVRMVSLPYARSGIAGSVFLALGRALGETMAVTMVIGNTPRISLSLLDPAYTMAAVIANELAEATSDIYVHSLIAMGLVLFAITFVINGLARWMIHRLEFKEAR